MLDRFGDERVSITLPLGAVLTPPGPAIGCVRRGRVRLSIVIGQQRLPLIAFGPDVPFPFDGDSFDVRGAEPETEIDLLPLEIAQQHADEHPDLFATLDRSALEIRIAGVLRTGSALLDPLTLTDLPAIVEAFSAAVRLPSGKTLPVGSDELFLIVKGEAERSTDGSTSPLRTGQLVMGGEANATELRAITDVELMPVPHAIRSHFDLPTAPQQTPVSAPVEREPQPLPSVPVETSASVPEEPTTEMPLERERNATPVAKTTSMTWWERVRFPFVPQHEPADCGAACLAMVVRHANGTGSVSQIRDLAGVTTAGASLAQLRAAAEDLGFEGTVWRLTPDRLSTLQRPAILFWEGRHFVVLLGIDGHRVHIADPAVGKLSLTLKELKTHYSGYALELVPATDGPMTDGEASRIANGLPDRSTTASRFRSLLWRERRTLLLILIVSLVLNLIGLAPALFTQQILDRLAIDGQLGVVNLLAFGLVTVSLVEIVMTWIRGRVAVRLGQRLDRRLLAEFFSHLMSLPSRFFRLRRTGDLLARFEDSVQVRELFASVTLTTLLDAGMVVVYFGLMFRWNVLLASVVLAFVPLFILFTLVVSPVMKRLTRRDLEDAAAQEAQLIETLSGIETVKALAAEEEATTRWQATFERSLRTQLRSQDFGELVTALGGAIGIASNVTLLWVGAVLVTRGQLSPGEYMAFSILAGQVTGPLSRLVGIWDDIQQARVSLERLGDVLSAKPEQPRIASGDRTQPSPLTLDSLTGAVRFREVSFRYNRMSQPVFQHLDLNITPGERIAIVGRSGAGKTTLLRLLLGLERPTSGRIEIDGHDLHSVDLTAYRRQVGIVPQESVLFSGTLLENITFGHASPDKDRAWWAAEAAGIAEFIRRLPTGMSTVTGDVGASLSGGQRQRLCIARAIYGDPKIVLFDEATSALDAETERAVQRSLNSTLAGRTVIVIAHRLETIRESDRIVVLSEGRILQLGTHAELIAEQGLYRHLYNNGTG